MARRLTAAEANAHFKEQEARRDRLEARQKRRQAALPGERKKKKKRPPPLFETRTRF